MAELRKDDFLLIDIDELFTTLKSLVSLFHALHACTLENKKAKLYPSTCF